MTHPVPAAIDQLLVLFRGAPALDGVRVDDGPPVDDLDEGAAIGVGLGVQEASAAQVTSGYDLAGRNDTMDLLCVAQCWSGDRDPAPLRARTYELFDVVGALLALNPDLGGAVTWARVARHSYRPVQGPDGAMAVIEFTVRVDANRDHEG